MSHIYNNKKKVWFPSRLCVASLMYRSCNSCYVSHCITIMFNCYVIRVICQWNGVCIIARALLWLGVKLGLVNKRPVPTHLCWSLALTSLHACLLCSWKSTCQPVCLIAFGSCGIISSVEYIQNRNRRRYNPMVESQPLLTDMRSVILNKYRKIQAQFFCCYNPISSRSVACSVHHTIPGDNPDSVDTKGRVTTSTLHPPQSWKPTPVSPTDKG